MRNLNVELREELLNMLDFQVDRWMETQDLYKAT